MTIANVTHNVFSLGRAGGTSSPDQDTTGADIVIVGSTWYTPFSSLPTVSDNKSNGNSTALTTQNSSGGGGTCISYWKNPAVGSGHHWITSQSESFSAIGVLSFSGSNLSAPFDQENTNYTTGSTTTQTTGSVTPTSGQNNEVIVAFLSLTFDSTDSSSSINSSFSTPDTIAYQAGNTLGCAISYKIKTDGTAENPQFSWTTSTSNVGASIASFKAAAAGITFDAASNSGDQAASANYTFNRTVTQANPYLSVNVELLTVTGATVTSVTDDDGGGNNALTFIGARSTVTGAGRVECWGLAGPVSGTKAIRVILSASIESVSTAQIHGGVNQTSPIEAFNSNQATNVGAANATVTVTPVSDNCWVIAACVANDTAITAGQTSRNNVSGTLGSGADEDSGLIHPATATTMTYSVGASKTWAIAGYAIRPVADANLGNILPFPWMFWTGGMQDMIGGFRS